MTRSRSIVMGFGGFTGFGSGGLPKVRCGFTSRASAASLTASTSSTVRQRFENLKMLTRRGLCLPLVRRCDAGAVAVVITTSLLCANNRSAGRFAGNLFPRVRLGTLRI
ncbi:MAG TPA: hypothetical protein VFK06_05650 [Candidatus Angelobacter sp.]|nr:hypothetical protein [Candidatus Angelobacter sp.]